MALNKVAKRGRHSHSIQHRSRVSVIAKDSGTSFFQAVVCLFNRRAHTTTETRHSSLQEPGKLDLTTLSYCHIHSVLLSDLDSILVYRSVELIQGSSRSTRFWNRLRRMPVQEAPLHMRDTVPFVLGQEWSIAMRKWVQEVWCKSNVSIKSWSLLSKHPWPDEWCWNSEVRYRDFLSDGSGANDNSFSSLAGEQRDTDWLYISHR